MRKNEYTRSLLNLVTVYDYEKMIKGEAAKAPFIKISKKELDYIRGNNKKQKTLTKRK